MEVKQLAIRQRKNNSIDRKKNLIAHYSPDSIVSEQFRSIRTNIHFLSTLKAMQTLLITSPNDGEGKSTTAVNLAVSMSQHNNRVLLIDANLRKPTVHLTFKISNTIGLTSVLADLESFDQAINNTEIGQLDILPSGPVSPFPSELLASRRLNKLLAYSLELYDYVVIDSPSVLDAVDTKVIANHCDGVILVANPKKTGLKQIFEAKRILEFANSNIVGVILNEK